MTATNRVYFLEVNSNLIDSHEGHEHFWVRVSQKLSTPCRTLVDIESKSEVLTKFDRTQLGYAQVMARDPQLSITVVVFAVGLQLRISAIQSFHYSGESRAKGGNTEE